jgi:DNA repair exonuclease SbcCD ATPase subunit
MPKEAMAAHLCELEDEATSAFDKSKELTTKISALEAEASHWRRWEQWKSNYDTRKAGLEERLADIELVEAPEGTLKDFRGVISDYDEQSRNLETVSHEHGTWSRAHSTAKALHADTERRLAALRKEHKEKVIKELTVGKARKALDRDTQRGEELATLNERVRLLSESIAEDEAAIEKIEFQLSRHAKKAQYKAIMQGIRTVTHAKYLPQVVAQRNLEDMEDDVNSSLSTFGDPFWAEASDDLTFDVHFPGAPARKATRLSGGQKVVLAVSFRTVVSSLFGAELGMLVLDEPAAGLDERNIAFLSDALAQFAAEVRGRRQIIVITHAETLKPAFDQVIELG